MKTFKGTVASDFRVVIPDQMVQQFRKDAQEGSTAFLKKANELHPTNDDAFMSLVISNGMRAFLKHNLTELFTTSGMGGTVSPARVGIIEVAEDHDAPVNPVVIVKGVTEEVA